VEQLKISGVKVYIVSRKAEGNLADSTRAIGELGYLIVDILTDSGIHGIGLTYHEVGTDAIRDFILGTITPLIMGMDPLQNEVIFEKVFHHFRGVGRKGLAFCALSAVDIALWDIKGKYVKLPLFRLLGGSRNKVPVYSSAGWTSYTTKELCDEISSMAEEGYTMVKMKAGVEGGNNFREDLRRLAAVRKAVGPNLKIAVDANNVWKAGTAIQFAARAVEYDIEFFEEPVPADDIPGLVHCRNSMSIPLATGEHEYTRFGARELLVAGACDVLQADVCRVGGYTEMLKILALSQSYNVWFAPHCMELMHMHLLAAATNGLTLESLTLFRPVTRDTFIDPPLPKDGFLEIPEKPGLGLELNMEYINKYGI
jgi:L-alanine-DL-glutamate epimerase-like enolase superfamily enzyme